MHYTTVYVDIGTVWCVSNKAYERYSEILHHTDTSYLVWLENNDFKYMVLEDIEPPKREYSCDDLKRFEEIINRLKYTIDDGKNEKDEKDEKDE